jgi:uncharacterized protein YbjT (DUF2867 family)
MNVIVTGSLGNISRILVEKLTAKGHEVTVITSRPERAKEIEELNAIPAVGSVEDYEFLKKSFEGNDAAYLMIPPNFRTADLKGYIRTVGEQYANALKETGVKYVINLSSIGSHLENGQGPTGSNFYVEQKLNELENANVLHLRPGMFLSNFYGAIPMIKEQNIQGNNFGGDVNLPLTHPRDIANVAFKFLNDLSISGKKIQYIVSDVKNGFEIAQTLGNAVGKSDVNWIEFSDEQLLGALMQSGFSEQMAKVYMVEIGAALRDKNFMEDYNKNKPHSTGGTTLQDFSKEFAMAYK